jgi:hypothetical protein
MQLFLGIEYSSLNKGSCASKVTWAEAFPLLGFHFTMRKPRYWSLIREFVGGPC